MTASRRNGIGVIGISWRNMAQRWRPEGGGSAWRREKLAIGAVIIIGGVAKWLAAKSRKLVNAGNNGVWRLS